METFSARLSHLIENKGYKNTNEFAFALGYSKSEKIRRLVSDKKAAVNNPSFEILQDIANKFGDLNMSWLLTGKGEMLKSNSYVNDIPVRALNEPNNFGVVTVVVDAQSNSLVPVINAKAAAGLPQGLTKAEYWSSVPSVTMPFPWFKSGEYILIQIKGESMSPTIYDGDWTFCKKLNDHKEIKDGYIHIIVTDDAVLCKRVLNRIDKRGMLALQSDNDTFTTYEVPIEDVRSIYKVEMKLSAILKNEGADLRKVVNTIQSELFEMKLDLDSLLKKGNK